MIAVKDMTIDSVKDVAMHFIKKGVDRLLNKNGNHTSIGHVGRVSGWQS